MAQQSPSFAAELRRLRVQANMSLADLADTVHYSKGYLSKIETGAKAANTDLARRCDAALGARGALAGLLAPSRSRQHGPYSRTFADRSAWPLNVALPGVNSPAPVAGIDELDVTMINPAALTIPLVDRATAAEDEATVASLWSLTRAYYELAERAGPGVVLTSMIALMQELRALASHAPEPNRSALLFLASAHATQVGQGVLDTGNDTAASWWADLANALAVSTEKDEAIAHSSLLSAEINLYRGDPASVIDVVDQVHRKCEIPPRLRGMVLARKARAYALIGDYDRCQQALDESGTWFDRDDPRILDGMTTGRQDGLHVHGVWSAWCWYDLGLLRPAAETLDREVPRFSSRSRWSTRGFRVRQALTYAALGEVDHACALTDAQLDLMGCSSTSLIRRDLRDIMRTLGRWRTHRPVQELRTRLMTVLQTPS